MTQPNDPAFPVSPSDYSAKHGLTKREYFAAMAMSAITNVISHDSMIITPRVIAGLSVELADTLIEKLNSTEDAK